MAREWAGKLVGVAELIDVSEPIDCTGHPWHVPGQWGLILGRVWEVEPVPCIGARGFWWAGQCPQCDALQAREYLAAPCRRCKIKSYPGTMLNWRRPELRIVRECPE